MKRSYEASTSIAARKTAIWSLLTDAAAYPRWNTTIDRIEGTIASGGDLKVWAKIAPGRAFPAHVAELSPPRRMVWTFRGPLGMFGGTRTFELEGEDGAVTFRTREDFHGWMAWLIIRTMPDLQPSFDELAASLKRAAEATR